MTLDDLYPLDERLKGQPLHQTLASAWEKGRNPFPYVELESNLPTNYCSAKERRPECIVWCLDGRFWKVTYRPSHSSSVYDGIYLQPALPD